MRYDSDTTQILVRKYQEVVDIVTESTKKSPTMTMNPGKTFDEAVKKIGRAHV